MKTKQDRDTTLAAIASFIYLAAYAIAMWRHDFYLFAISTAILAIAIYASGKIEKAEKRLKRYQKYVDREIRELMEDEEP